ncbi:MAG: TRAP transporter TatT component family protein [Polyangiales bacterium]
MKGFLAVGLMLAQVGCMTRLAANSTVKIMGQAAPAVNTFADPYMAEGAIPYSIAQSEGLMLVIPDNVPLRVNLMRTYGSYGFAFLEDRMEQAEVEDNEERANHYRSRAVLAFQRAREIGLQTMTLEEDGDGGAEAAVRRGIDGWKAYLRRFDDDEQTALVFWTGYAWARYINLTKDNPDSLADLPFAIACFERAFELDHTFNNYAPHVAMAGYYARAAPSLGGQPEDSRREFEAAINATQRHFLTYLVMQARMYAVMVQDRALFRRLLEEVINAGDVMPEQRLANQIAKRRAARYLAQIDDLFGPEEPAGSTPEATPAEAQGEAAAPTGEAAAPAAAPAQ